MKLNKELLKGSTELLVLSVLEKENMKECKEYLGRLKKLM